MKKIVMDLFNVEPEFNSAQRLRPMVSAMAGAAQTKTGQKYSSFYKVFNVNLDSQRVELQNIMNKILNDPSYFLFKEESSFSKDGSYIVALKWAVWE